MDLQVNLESKKTETFFISILFDHNIYFCSLNIQVDRLKNWTGNTKQMNALFLCLLMEKWSSENVHAETITRPTNETKTDENIDILNYIALIAIE